MLENDKERIDYICQGNLLDGEIDFKMVEEGLNISTRNYFVLFFLWGRN